jgi:hypothetical protein
MTQPRFLPLLLAAIVLVGATTTIGLWLIDADHPAILTFLNTAAAISLLKTLPEESP